MTKKPLKKPVIPAKAGIQGLKSHSKSSADWMPAFAGMTPRVLLQSFPKWIAQAAWFALFAAGVGFFSVAPRYRHLDAEQALLKLSISHAGQLLGACRDRSAEELARLPHNMRALQECPRERSPVTIEVELDGHLLYHEVVAPSGWSRDGAATVYRRFPLRAGEHKLSVRLNDSARVTGFNYQRSEVIQLQPAQVLVIDFNQQQGGILIK